MTEAGPDPGAGTVDSRPVIRYYCFTSYFLASVRYAWREKCGRIFCLISGFWIRIGFRGNLLSCRFSTGSGACQLKN
jgi:hypothetical protein